MVYYYDADAQLQKSVLRHKTKHLDHEPDDVIEQWVKRHEALSRVIASRPDLVSVDADALRLVDRFCAYLKTDQARKSITVQIHRSNLLEYALPYFHHVCKVRMLQDYQNHSRRLGLWLLETAGLSETKARYVQMSLRVFWMWLVEEGLVEASALVLKRIKKPAQSTPLKHKPQPADILGWQSKRPDIRLVAILG